jgi:hypothetical protein
MLMPFTGTPYAVAPERAKELEDIIAKHGLKIFFDTSSQEFTIFVSHLLSQIRLAFQPWNVSGAYSYSYLLYRVAVSEGAARCRNSI